MLVAAVATVTVNVVSVGVVTTVWLVLISEAGTPFVSGAPARVTSSPTPKSWPESSVIVIVVDRFVVATGFSSRVLISLVNSVSFRALAAMPFDSSQ